MNINRLYTGPISTNESLKDLIALGTMRMLKREYIAHEHVVSLESFLHPYELVIEIADKKTQCDKEVSPGKKVILEGVRVKITLSKKEIKAN